MVNEIIDGEAEVTIRDDNNQQRYSYISECAEPDPSGPIGECRYVCYDAEHVGDGKYVCLYPDHWAAHLREMLTTCCRSQQSLHRLPGELNGKRDY